MQTNRMRQRVEKKEVQIGTWINMVGNPAILTLLKSAGVDFARVDMEHSGASIETIAQLAVMARAIDFPIAVRPPRANREWITRLLDVGVYNLHCPQIESAAQAREVVDASRYAPMGLRGWGGTGPAFDYEKVSMAEAKAFANKEVFVTVMLETGAVFDELDEIAAMDGIDALTLGPADLAQDLGVAGTPDQARVLDERRQMVLDAANKHGKTTAMLVSSAEEAKKWGEAGVLLLGYSSEVETLHQTYSAKMRELKEGIQGAA